MSGYLASVSPIKLLIPKNPLKDQVKPPKKYFDFYLYGKEGRGCFSTQNPPQHEVINDKSKSEGDHQGCIIKKVRLNDENNDFLLTDFTTISKSKLTYEKVDHKLNYILVSHLKHLF